MNAVYQEGRCRQCGLRVTLERGEQFHRGGDGTACGPVETHKPGHVTDEAPGRAWVVPPAPADRA